MAKLKVFRDNNLIFVAQTLEFVFERVEKIVGKGENTGQWHFPLFSKVFFTHKVLERPLHHGHQSLALCGKFFYCESRSAIFPNQF